MLAGLSEVDRVLWARVARSVTPLGERSTPEETLVSTTPAVPSVRMVAPLPNPSTRPTQPHQLDGGWERRLAKGLVEPDRVLDLHGLRLDAAWERLDATMSALVLSGGRVLLVIAGRDRGPDVRQQPGARGRIRAKLPDWLHASPHAARIAAVRSAHARHGGAGAVYVVLRRTRAYDEPTARD